VRTIFAQPDAGLVREQLEVIATMLGRQFPKVGTMLRGAADEVTAFADFPVAHDEWQVSERRYLSEASMALLTTKPTEQEVAPPQMIPA